MKVRQIVITLVFVFLLITKPFALYVISFDKKPTNVKVNDVFPVNVSIYDIYSQDVFVCGVGMYIEFNPEYLQLTDSQGNNLQMLSYSGHFELTIVNSVDNNTGAINLAVITLGQCIQSPLPFTTLYFKVKKTGTTTINFQQQNCELLLNYSSLYNSYNNEPYSLTPAVSNLTVIIGNLILSSDLKKVAVITNSNNEIVFSFLFDEVYTSFSKLEIYNSKGQKIKEYIDNGTGIINIGNFLTNGVYLYKLTILSSTQTYTKTGKFVVIK